MKKKQRRQRHNLLETHEERMTLRKAQRKLRIATVRVKTGKYIPAEEDKKHSEVN